MKRPLTDPREVGELHDDESGQLLVEWILLVGTIILPLSFLATGALYMMKDYFYRITGVLCLPFP